MWLLFLTPCARNAEGPKKFLVRCTPPYMIGGVADACPHVCYYTEFGHSRSSSIDVSRGSQKYGDSARPLRSREFLNSEKHTRPLTGVTAANLVILDQMVGA